MTPWSTREKTEQVVRFEDAVDGGRSVAVCTGEHDCIVRISTGHGGDCALRLEIGDPSM